MSTFSGQATTDVLALSVARHGLDLRLGEHFTLVELASRDGADAVLVHPALVLLLNRIRRHFKVPAHVSSGYRSPNHNRAIGGAQSSLHMLGMAADIALRGVPPADVAAFAERLGVGGVGRYAGFTHVDVGPTRRWAG